MVENNPVNWWDLLGLEKIIIRIDVPGQNPKSSKDHISTTEITGGDADTGHAWVVFDPEDGSGKSLSIGYYPKRAPNFAEGYNKGVTGEIRDDEKHHYEYVFEIDVCKEDYDKALSHALSVNKQWGASYNCVDYVIDVLAQINVKICSIKVKITRKFWGTATSRFAGQFAKDLAKEKKGEYKAGGSKGHDVGSIMTTHDPHRSPALSEEKKKAWTLRPPTPKKPSSNKK